MSPADTIAAIATPPGRGGVGIVRVSGPLAPHIATQLCQTSLTARHAHYLPFVEPSGQVVDHGIAILFPAPYSFTGEDVLELHGHGGPVVMELLLAAVCACGARMARAGEFSERAFINDKLDLAQAEAVADLINASTQQAARSAVRALDGAFAKHIDAINHDLTQLRLYVESAIDFPEEEIDFLSSDTLLARVEGVLARIEALMQQAREGQLLRDGVKTVIVGAPNAGKSSLLNRLAGTEAAIVTDVPGTTRDLLHQHIHIDGIPLHLTDTAGLRETTCKVEQLGVARARAEMENADLVLLVIDAQAFDGAAPLALTDSLEQPVIIKNKIDKTGEKPGAVEGVIQLSAKTGAGIDVLKQTIKARLGVHEQGETPIIARRRHLQAIAAARGHLQEGLTQLRDARAGELFAEECRCAQQALSEITGQFTADDLLGEIFSSFCIGK